MYDGGVFMSNFISFSGASNRYPSRRSVVYGKNGMVCTSQTLAAQAGLDILKKGGNAIDAAIATSDLFALVWYKGKLYGLNGSGPAPLALTREKVLAKLCMDGQAKGNYKDSDEILNLDATPFPDKGWETVNVPAAPASWKALHERFGVAEFGRLFEAAIRYADFHFSRYAADCGRRMSQRFPG